MLNFHKASSLIHRIFHKCIRRRIWVHDPVDKRAVCTILQEPSDEIGQQIRVRTDRRVHRNAGLLLPQDMIIERLPHPMQALQLKRRAILTGHLHHRGDTLRVMGGQHGVEMPGLAQEFLRANHKAQIRRALARVDRKTSKALLLRVFDLTIPIGAFHQAHLEAAFMRRRQICQMVNKRAGAGLIGLHRDAKPLPSAQLWTLQHRLNHLQ